MGSGRERRRATAAIAGLVAAVLAGAGVLAGCGGGAGDNSSVSSAGGSAGGSEAKDAAGAPAPAAPQGGLTAGQSGKGQDNSQGGSAQPGGLARVAPQLAQQQLIRKADLAVRVKDVRAAEKEAKRQVAAAGGMVFSEQSNQNPGDPASASVQLTFKVPPDRLDALVGSLGDLGTQLSSNASTEDVTDQVVDVAARIRSQRESVERVRALLGQAKTLGEVVQVESQLTSRVADLEALESKQKALAAQVSLSTLALTLSTSGQPPAKPKKDDTGFLAGLRGGWHAFAASVAVALMVVGALLPFLVVVALLWLPVRWAVRQARRRLEARGPQVTQPEAGPAPSA
jgi:hypothetical protein